MEQLSLFNTEEKPYIVNVAQVKKLSPFRYPGGKTWLVPKFCEWINKLPTRPNLLIEPFLGGGIISLSAIYYNLVDKGVMIEKDEEVSAVWKTILYGDWQKLIQKILTFNLTTETAKEIIEKQANTVEEVAFKTIIKNRIFHGGILAEGSGFLKHGENGKGILSRWYPATLARRIETIAAMRDRFVFHEGDAFDFINQYTSYDNVVFFVDPPYTASKKKAGKRLYKYSDINHERLFSLLKNVNGKFMLTYDYDDTVVEMAKKHEFLYEKVPMKGTHLSLRYELIITK